MLKKIDKKYTKSNLATLTFSVKTYKKIKEKNKEKLTNTAKDFFHLLSEFSRLKKQEDEIKIIMLDDQIQELPTDTIGIFQLLCYKNLFDPVVTSKISNDDFLTLNNPILDKVKKSSQNFIFTLLCGASKGFMKAFKAFKPFEAPQRSVKIKI